MKISIILINYYTEELLINCLESVYHHERSELFEILILNNGGTLKNLQNHFSNRDNILVIDSGGNIGFSKANNLGIANSSGEYLLFLNSDTLFIAPVLNEMVRKLENNPRVGMLGCQLLNSDLSLQKSYHDGNRLFSKLWRRNPIALKYFRVTARIQDLKHQLYQKHDEEHNAPWLSGACLMLRKKDIEKHMWYWDDDFFMYWEDVELSYRIRKKGFYIRYSPNEKIIHLGGGGEENISLSRFSMMEDAKLIFIEKTKGKTIRFIYQLIFKLELRLERHLNRNQVVADPILLKEIDFYLKKGK